MITAKKCEEALETARANLAKMEPFLPTKVSAGDLNVWATAPYKALVVRGGLLWRSQELGTDAIQAFADGRLATAIILTRAVIENVALHWRLSDLITQRKDTSGSDLSDTLSRMLVGWKNDKEFPQAFNALTMVDRLDKIIPGVRDSYDQLSEVAHPNYGGVHGLYAENDEENFVTHLGPNVRDATPRHAVLILAASLGLQFNADVQFSDALKEWIGELPSLDDERPQDEEWWEPKAG